jgi:hypothetical protein
MRFKNPGAVFLLGVWASIVGLLLAGLWPFNFSPKNRAGWIPGRRGLYFDGAHRHPIRSVGGLARLSLPHSPGSTGAEAQGSFTLSLHLMASQDTEGGVPHLLSFVEPSGREALYLGQFKRDLIVRWYESPSGGRRALRELGVGGAFMKAKARWITVVSDPGGASIFLDGEVAARFPGERLLAKGRSIGEYSLVLGNSPEAANPWTGTFLDMALYDRILDPSRILGLWGGGRDGFSDPAMGTDGLISAYRFEGGEAKRVPDLSGRGGGLLIPERIAVRKKMLAWPEFDAAIDAWIWKDILINVLGFVPFGFLASGWLEKRGRRRLKRPGLIILLAGGGVSLGIEAAQSLMPIRDSSLVDFACNALGVILGIAAYRLAMRLRRKAGA